jgi:hypothetical protein
MTQRIQLFLQRRVIARVLTASAPVRPPRLLLFFARRAIVRRTLGRVLGLGIRPEHVAQEIIAGPPRASTAPPNRPS